MLKIFSLFHFCVFTFLLFIFPLFFVSSSLAESSGIYLSEFLADPEEGSEWVEIYNSTNLDFDLSGWQIDDIEGGSAPFTIADGTIIAADSYLVFEFTNKLNNSGDSVRLLNAEGVVVDQTSYEQTKKGYSWAIVSDGWQLTLLPSPGEKNQILVPTPSPIIMLPTPTSSPTPTSFPSPTPTLVEKHLQIMVSVQEEVEAGTLFKVPVTVKNADPKKEYAVKVLVGSDKDSLFAARTLGHDGETWLAWNASWVKYPTFVADKNGNGTVQASAQIDPLSEEGEYLLQVRLRSINNSKNYDSDLVGLQVNREKEEVTQVLSDQVSNFNQQEEPDHNLDEDQLEDLELMLIGEMKEQETGSQVKVEGVITSSLEELGSRTFYLEDETGGIKVVTKDKDWEDLERGRYLQVRGELREAFNDKYLKVDYLEDILFLGEGDLPDPKIVKTGQANEQWEGQLIHVNGQVTSTSGNVFYLDDGSGELKVYIKGSTGIDKPKMRTGFYAVVNGILSQYKETFRLLPRIQEDLLVSETPIEEGDVLAGVTELPQTGSGYTWSYLATALVLAGLGFYLRLYVFLLGFSKIKQEFVIEVVE